MKTAINRLLFLLAITAGLFGGIQKAAADVPAPCIDVTLDCGGFFQTIVGVDINGNNIWGGMPTSGYDSTGSATTNFGSWTGAYQFGSENTDVGYAALFGDSQSALNDIAGYSAPPPTLPWGFSDGSIAVGAYAGIGTTASSGQLFAEYNIFYGMAAGSNATGSNNIYMGYEAAGNNSSSIGDNNIGIGYFTTVNLVGSANNFIGNGSGSYTRGDQNTGIGDGAGTTTVGVGNFTMGESAGQNVTGNGNFSYGYQVGDGVTGNNNYAIGDWSTGQNVIGNNNMAIGGQSGSQLQGSDNFAGGANSSTWDQGNSNMRLGGGGNDYGSYNTTINVSNYTGSENLILGLAGNSWPLSGNMNTLVGGGTQTNGDSNQGFGPNALSQAVGNTNSAIGENAGGGMYGNNNVAVGQASGGSIHGDNNLSLGVAAGNYYGSDNITVGSFAGDYGSMSNSVFLTNDAQYSGGSFNVAVGFSAGNSSQGNDVTVGIASQIRGNQGNVIIGTLTDTNGSNSIALGYYGFTQGYNDVAIGNGAQANNTNSLSIGPNSNSDNSNSVNLAHYNYDTSATPTSSATIDGFTITGFAGSQPFGDFSVGNSGNRNMVQVNNVAAGQINANSTDGINGSELYQVLLAMQTPGVIQAGSSTNNSGGSSPSYTVANQNSANSTAGEIPATLTGAAINSDGLNSASNFVSTTTVAASASSGDLTSYNALSGWNTDQ